MTSIKTKNIIIILILSLLLSGCSFNSADETNINNICLQNFGSGDAKLGPNNQIFASKNGELVAVDPQSKTEKQFDIQSNWIDCLNDENIIIYSNGNRQTKICQFDENNNIIFDNLIVDDGFLHIDPAITKVDNTYYITTTKIIGNVNVADPNMENGEYTLQLYKSINLSDWEYVTDILSYKSNIEDVDLIDDDNCLRLTFEKETYDKGKSAIYQIESSDRGFTWENEKELISCNADNEPATFRKNNKTNEYELYYSSDIETPGESYSGASIYLTKFDNQLNFVSTEKIKTNPERNILLYEVSEKKDHLLLLFAYDYLGKNDLYIQELNL
ncbi:hypothetical protein ACH52_0686 [Eubacterium limosum]|nr:hypothetical protein ACH52_0686 [Eubacterium limosum]